MTAEPEAFERWARARGVIFCGGSPVGPREWIVNPYGGMFTISHSSRAVGTWGLDPLTALLWANAVESRVDGLALLVCEAAPVPGGVHGELCKEPREEWYPPEPGDPSAREALTVEADRLLADGQPLGEWAAAWLRGECPACEGGGWVMVPWSANGLVKRECVACHGHGVLLGAHVDAMIAGLFAV